MKTLSMYKKIFAGSLAVLAMVSYSPNSAHAIWGQGDVSIDPVNAGTQVTQIIGQIEEVANMVQTVLKEFGLDVLINKLSQKATEKIVQKVLNNANEGADGEKESLIIDDFSEYFNNISLDQAVGATTALLNNSKNPYAKSIGAAIADDYANGGSPLNLFNLDTVGGTNWKDGIKKIDSLGSRGWDFYSSISYPQNTPVGSSMIAQQELINNINYRKEVARQELDYAGSRPDKGSNYVSNPNLVGLLGTTETGPPATEAQVESGQAQGPLTAYQQGNQATPLLPQSSSEQAVQDGTAQGPMTQDQQNASASPLTNTTSTGTGTQTMTIGNGTWKAKIQTPRFSNDAQVNQATMESISRLREADEVGKFLSNTIHALTDGLIQKGLRSLKSDGGTSKSIFGSPRDARSLLQNNASWTSAPEQTIDLQESLDAGITKTDLEIKYFNSLLTSIKQPVSGTISDTVGGVPEERVILKLEQCLPRPDTGWERRLSQYSFDQTQDTQKRASSSGNDDKAENNSQAYTIIQRLTEQAILEEKDKISNPVLNMPAAEEFQAVISDYYRTARNFKSSIEKSFVKRQVLGRLKTIKGEVTAFAPSLILFNDQWNNLNATQKNALYASLANDIKTQFPEYVNPDATGGPGSSILLPLTADDPATTNINESDADMKKRVFDTQWYTWEDMVSEKDRQNIYAKYAAIANNISDTGTVRNLQIQAQAAQDQMVELKKTLDDCRSVRNYIVTPGAYSTDEIFKDSLKTDRIRNSFSGPSILTAVETGVNFAELNERIVEEEELLPGIDDATNFLSGSNTDFYIGNAVKNMNPNSANTLQVNVPTTPSELLQQDAQSRLFCRLTFYHLYYWAPSPTGKELTGKPVSCAKFIPGQTFPYPEVQSGYPDLMFGWNFDGVRAGGFNKKVASNWYHTNLAEILFILNDE